MLNELTELIDLLTSRELDRKELAEISAAVTAAPQNPKYEWTESPAQAIAFELLASLGDWCAQSDKLDEMHEQLQNFFSAPFPDFPDTLANGDSPGPFEYFLWLDRELSQHNAENGGDDVVNLDVGEEGLNIFVVNRQDVPRILQLAVACRLQIQSPLKLWSAN